MWESIKKILGAVPSIVWVILAIVLLVMGFWFKDDVGAWWEKRQEAKFDKVIAEKQVQIDDLTKQRDDAIKNAEVAEAREQGKIIEADLLRQEAAKQGVNIEAAQKKIEEATQEFADNEALLEKVKNGEVSKLQLCELQCQDSAKQGFPCRPNYCDPFKGK